MSELARTEAFATSLREAIGRFRKEEEQLIKAYKKDSESDLVPDEIELDRILERPTRRFLIDPMLRALDWDLDNPNVLAEEARSWIETEGRLYFDYLGINQGGLATMLVEAKGADADIARKPREEGITGERMAKLISEALNALKEGEIPKGILKQWAEWLKDLRDYVMSLDNANRQSLQRVVITSGRWLVIFRQPLASFIEHGTPNPEIIHCYVSFEDITERHNEVYRLLARQRLTDTLPLTLDLSEALGILNRSAISHIYRGVVVVTTTGGGVRGIFPSRAFHPAVVMITGERAFAVVDNHTEPLREPTSAEDLPNFLNLFSVRGSEFEQRVLRRFGRNDLTASPIDQYPSTIRAPDLSWASTAVTGSTAAMVETLAQLRPQLVRATGERGAENEYLVITGTEWFYKLANPFGSHCAYHSFPDARSLPGGSIEGKFARTLNGFSISADLQHCENQDLRGMRGERCQMDVIESHLCCRACLLHEICWTAQDRGRLPCPP